MPRTWRESLVILASASITLAPGLALAQSQSGPDRTVNGTKQVGQGAPGAARSDLQSVAPQPGRTIEEERDPGRGPRPHEPVFIEPAATTTEHTRLGLSAWIAPGAPFERRENPGGVAIGFTIAWPAGTRAPGPSAPRP